LHRVGTSLLNGLLEHLDVVATVFPHSSQVHERLVVLSPSWVLQVTKHVAVLVQPVGVLEVFKVAGGLDTVPSAHLLILVLSIDLLTVKLRDVLSDITDLLDKVHIVSHDLQVVRLMNLALDLKTLL